MTLLKKIYNYVFDILFLFILKKRILICTYPKTGSTILRMRICSLINNLNFVNHKIVNSISPEFGKGFIYKYKGLTLIKSHKLFSRLFFIGKPKITIIRDPYDTLLSYFSYVSRISGIKINSRSINEFLSSPHGIRNYKKYVNFFYKNKNNPKWLIIKYEDYILDPKLFHFKINSFIGINYNDSQIDHVINFTSRKRLSLDENKSKSKLEINFSKKKNYNNLKILINKKNNTEIRNCINDYNKI